MQEETLRLTFDLTVEVEQPIWINKQADRENYIEHYANRYKNDPDNLLDNIKNITDVSVSYADWK
ncbi:hypothetical protein [Staphylococcus haemolyticus]|uniref:hypothetical protein n=1 Tax=Staphylococcus haemolyticus TaxID=1283 RepID=UPI00065FA078|nr:hypothetical protein [Staphylococcus haemolyticus]MBW4892679.1 hypothetical protein [Staphylococcus haemolyticus]MCK6069083.1 hypothetical protein [Staphylococcus haemolyticus]MCK6111080.1 hypothetical protein [Staphylococcus haemolyticus]MCK6168589.1 hypothetical protein [Staphylococcus haemolyticus]MDQ7226965.1 hypothetical protein [Staphylococcus haemolyticus]